MTRLKGLYSMLILTGTLVLLCSPLLEAAEGIISKVPTRLANIAISGFRQSNQKPLVRIDRFSRIKARGILSTFTGLAIMTLSVKTQLHGRRTIC